MGTTDLAVAVLEAERITRKLRAVLPLERKLRRQLAKTWVAQQRAATNALARFAGDFTEALREAADPTDVERAVTKAIRTDPALVTTIQVVADDAVTRGAGSAQLDLDVEGMFSLDHPDAVSFLTRRGADQVAAIDDVTRRYLRTIVTQAADEGWSYSRTSKAIRSRFAEFSAPVPQAHLRNRAELIAVTEVGEAYEHGNRMVADRLSARGVVLQKRWLTAGDERVCPICGPNEAAGWIAKEDGFPSGQDGPLGHPACRCTAQWRTREAPTPPSVGELDPLRGSRPRETDRPTERLSWSSPKAEKQFGDAARALDTIHGLHADDQVAATVVRVGTKTVRKGGHFSPHGKPLRRRRVTRKGGESVEEFQARVAKLRAEAAAPRPPEILVNPRADRDETEQVLSFLHEHGHRTDWGNGNYASELAGRGGRLSAAENEAFEDFFRAAVDNDHFRDARQQALRSGMGYYRYFTSRVEVWARAYSQWAARKVEIRAVGEALEAARERTAMYWWPDDLFDAEVAPAVEQVLRARGLMT